VKGGFMGKVCFTLIITLILACSAATTASNFYVSPNGSDSNPATKEKPVYSPAVAYENAQRSIKAQGYPQDGVTIWIEGGDYMLSRTIFIDSEVCDKQASPIVFKAYDGKAIFNGGRRIDLSSAKLVKDEVLLERLSPAARGKVYSIEIEDDSLKALLAKDDSRLSQDGQMMNLARYPNIGYAHINKIIEAGAVYTHGRTKGNPPEYNMQLPIGAVFSVLNKDISAWQTEFARVQKAKVAGYLSYDWYKEGRRIARIKDGNVKLLEYSRYGVVNTEKIPRRFRVSNLLCELDEPGEFYFDTDSGTLFFWPFRDSIQNSQLNVWAGVPFATLNKTSNLRFENIIVEGVSQGKAAFFVNECHNVEIAGCVIRNCAIPAVVIEGGANCGIRSCDIYDVPHHLTLSGGPQFPSTLLSSDGTLQKTSGPGIIRELTPSKHYAINCHFTQVQASDYYGKIQLKGVGQIFKNNLVHNFIGQVMTVSDNDHLVEYNEFFNIGIEEGDGGCIYSGAQMWSWGNVYRHNFLHHLMCLPQAHPRGGIYPDDLDKGDTIVENIFYKAAHRTVLVNGGAGHKVNRNIFLNGYIGIYNTEAWSESIYKKQAKYDSGELKRGDKDDHIWRTEQVVGKKGWNREPWLSKYPEFAKIMNQEKLRFWPIDCDFSNNCFAGNFRNIEYRTGWGLADIKDIADVNFIRSENNTQISMDVFKDPQQLDFSYKSEQIGKGLPDIQFDKIGLYKDEYRILPPDKIKYRHLIHAKFIDRKSYDPNAIYNPETINNEIYYNTGKLFFAADEHGREVIHIATCRDGLPNVFAKLSAGHDVTIAYFGGSITEQPGYRIQTFNWFKKEWPDVNFTEVNAAIGGTGSGLGAFRLFNDVLSHKPDIIFVEFAVNDYGGAVEDVTASMEGIVRQIIRHDPNTDICFIYTITEKMLVDDYKKGNEPTSITAHEKVAQHYGLPSINVGLSIVELDKLGKLTIKDPNGKIEAVSGKVLDCRIDVPVNEKGQIVFSKDGVHPYANTGHEIYTEAIKKSLVSFRDKNKPLNHALVVPISNDNLENVTMVSLSEVDLNGKWQKYDWQSSMLSLGIRKKMPDLMVTTSSGDSIAFKFQGSLVGFYDIMGPSSGVVECEIDGEKSYVSRFDKHCTYFRISSRTFHLNNGVHSAKFTFTDRDIDKLAILRERSNVVEDSAMYHEKKWYVGSIMVNGKLTR
jgi:hypothetical protein